MSYCYLVGSFLCLRVTGNCGLIRKNVVRNLLSRFKTLTAKAGNRLLLFSWEAFGA